MRAQIALLPDKRRLHLQDGPIDLVIEGFGTRDGVACAYEAASRRFIGLLDELCAELPDLRRPVTPDAGAPAGIVARRMFDAVEPFCMRGFITPMAAVAGSVADEILAAMISAAGARLTRAYVNNGGDIALHLGPGTHFVAGLIDRPDRPSLFAKARIGTGAGFGGIATSGARGRSFSLGIADAVTVLARNGAEADAAATIIANAVDLPGHPDIVRVPASSLRPDNDLGDIGVTRVVPLLSTGEIDAALARGAVVAESLRCADRITAAALHLQARTRFVGPAPLHHDASLRAAPLTDRALLQGALHG
jgi:uncharacterized protein